MYDPRNRLADEVSTQLLKHFKDKVYDTIIPRNVRLAEAPSFGLSAILHDRASRGAQAYVQLAEEVVRRDSAEAGRLNAHTAARLALECRASVRQPRRLPDMSAKRTGLGRGLDALLGDASAPVRPVQDRGPRGPAADSGGAPAARGIPAPPGHAPGIPRGPGPLHQGPGAGAADRRPAAAERHRRPGETRYEIIAGERRWRAAQMAGPRDRARRRPADPGLRRHCQSLIENIQRENLNPLEEAQAIQRLLERVPAHPPGRRRRHRPVPGGGHQPAAPAGARRAGPHPAAGGRARDGPCPGPAGASRIPRMQAEVASLVAKKEPLRPGDRAAGEARARGRRSPRSKAGGPRGPGHPAPGERALREAGRPGRDPASAPRAAGKLVVSYTSLDELDGIIAHIQ